MPRSPICWISEETKKTCSNLRIDQQNTERPSTHEKAVSAPCDMLYRWHVHEINTARMCAMISCTSLTLSSPAFPFYLAINTNICVNKRHWYYVFSQAVRWILFAVPPAGHTVKQDGVKWYTGHLVSTLKFFKFTVEIRDCFVYSRDMLQPE